MQSKREFNSGTCTIPSNEEAKKIDYSILCIIVGVLVLKVRTLPGSVKNVNNRLENHTKVEMLNLFKDELV